MPEDQFNDKNFGEESEMQSQEIDWGKPGDFLIGTFVKARHNVDTQFGPNSIYEFFSQSGSFHRLVGKGRTAKPEDNPTAIGVGETWAVWGRGDIFCGQANSLKPGQIVKILYVSDEDGKNGPWKKVVIRAPKGNDGKPMMNEEWLNNQGVSGIDFGD